MLTTTERGFRVAISTASAAFTSSNPITEIGDFLHQLKTEGLFHALTGMSFHDMLIGLYGFLDPLALITCMAFLLLIMFGSKRGVKYLYWNFALYIIAKVIGGMILL